MREDQVAAALRERYTAATPEITVDPAAVVRRGRRRRRTTRIAGAAAALVLVVAGGLALRGLLPDGAPQVADPPPPPAPTSLSLWLSAEQVPAGAEVGAVLVNTSPTDVTFGVLATVERWDGDSWDAHGQLPMCVEEWQCTAELVGPEVAVDVEDIGLSPFPDAPGPLERFSTAGLEPGWYRITHTSAEGETASGVLEVRDDAPQPAPLPPLDTAVMSVRPTLVPGTGGTVQLLPVVPAGSDGILSAEDVEAVIAGLGPEAAIERWDGAAWETVSRAAVEVPALQEARLTLPELIEGAYRVVHTSPDGVEETLTGSFWVVGPDLAPTLPHPDDEAGADAEQTDLIAGGT